MQRFKNILYLAGEDPLGETGFPRALSLARANEAKLTVASVVREPEGLAGALGFPVGEVHESVVRRRERALEELAERAEAAAVAADAHLLHGTPFLAAIRLVLREGHDLLMKVATGERGLRARFFGSTDHSLMRKCPVPVWLLDPARSARFRTVLAAVDPAGPHAEELNARIVQMASSLAAREGASFHVVHAWQLYGESLLRSRRTELSRRRLRELLRREVSERRARLEALLEREAEGPEPRVELHKGVPSRVISKVAKKVRADVLVMGAVSHGGVPGLLIGSTAETVLGRVRCAVLTVKPEGFRTPVEFEEPRVHADDEGDPDGAPGEGDGRSASGGVATLRGTSPGVGRGNEPVERPAEEAAHEGAGEGAGPPQSHAP